MQPISCLLFPTDRVYAWVGKASFRLEQSRTDLRHEPGAQKTARGMHYQATTNAQWLY